MFQLAVPPLFHAKPLPPQCRMGLLTPEMVSLSGEGKCVVVGDDEVIVVTHDRGQILSFAQGSMLIGVSIYRPGETLVPFPPVPFLLAHRQKPCGRREEVSTWLNEELFTSPRPFLQLNDKSLNLRGTITLGVRDYSLKIVSLLYIIV